MKIISFLRFAANFIMDGKYVVHKTNFAKMLELKEKDSYWHEFYILYGVEDVETQSKAMSLRMKVIHSAFVVLSWLKENPHAVTIDIRQIMESNPKFITYLDVFVDETTKTGAGVSVMNPNIDPKFREVKLKTPATLYNNAMYNLASILTELTTGFKRGEISRMDAETKIKLASNLASTLQKAFTQSSANSIVFNKITINKAGRQDLEKTMVEYLNTQE